MKPQIRYISLYERSQHYGGPEEGGWYYDWYDYTGVTMKIKVKDDSRHNVIGRYKEKANQILSQEKEHGEYHYHGGIEAIIERFPGAQQSIRTPHYE